MFDFEGLADTIRTVGDAPKSKSSCYHWSTRRRIMGSPFPGPYSTKYHPWCREILDSKAEFNVTLKSAQAGLTEVGINRALYSIDVRKLSVLYVLPTATNAADFSRARFGGALMESPYLKSIFSDTNSVGLKQAGSTNLYIRGSRGDSNLKSVPAAVLVMDEYDEFDQNAIRLALERLSGQREKEVWAISTPTIPDYGVSKQYLTTTQEHFYFKCPCCSQWTELIFPECMEVCGESVNDPRVHDSYLKCKECGGKLHHEDKVNFLASGTWRPTYHNGDPSRRGFAINQLYSSTVSPKEIAEAWIAAQTDEPTMKEFKNSKEGKPFLGQGAQITDDQIAAAYGDHSIHDERPISSGRLITMGYDQGRTGYVWIVEWFVDNLKDPNRTSTGKLLYLEKFDQYARGMSPLNDLMTEWQVQYAVTDADPEITMAREFCSRFRRYAATSRYRKGVVGNELAITNEDGYAPMITVDRTHWIGTALGRFKTGRISIPREFPDEAKSHLKALVATWEKDEFGNQKQTYVSTGPDHYAHAFVYAEIALAAAAAKYSMAGNITDNF